MWNNPNHPPPPRPTPPVDTGRPLARFFRLGSPYGRGDQQLRVTLATYNDRPYVALRIWEKNTAGDWWPLKGRGVSIRLREVADLVDALQRVPDLVADLEQPAGPFDELG